MLKLDKENQRFEKLEQSDLVQEKILERYDLQEAFINSWEIIRSKINLPGAFLIGKEITPHSSVQNSIDLLAFDPDDSSLIIIELKRSKDKLQLLQALSYSAMIATWDNETLIGAIQEKINPDPKELIDYINNNELSSNIKTILISEIYDPEVIITAEWLSSEYAVDITAFSVTLHKFDNKYFVNFEQRLPLKELKDIYEIRGSRKKSSTLRNNITWDDVKPKLKYNFGEDAINRCLLIKEGDPSRKRFVGVRKNIDNFDVISINFRENYLNIYLTGLPEDAENTIQSKFSTNVDISTWAKGYTFNIDNIVQYQELFDWLNIPSPTHPT